MAGAALVLLAIGLSVLDSGEPEPTLENGDGMSAAFTEQAQRYDLQLPGDAQDVEWLEVRDWDYTALYVRFATTRRGLAAVLDRHGISQSDLSPADLHECEDLPDFGCRALPRADTWREHLPARFVEWGPSSWATAKVTAWDFEPDPDGLPLEGLLIDRSRSPRPEVFLVAVR